MHAQRIPAAAGVALVAAAIVLVFWNPLADRHPADHESAATESSTRPPKLFFSAYDIRRDCTSSQISELLIGNERLFVDLRVLGSLALADDEIWPGHCPTSPLKTRELRFYIPDEVSGPIYRERGLRLFFLDILDPNRTSWHGPDSVPSAPERRVTIGKSGTIDHISEELLKFSPGTESGYRLEHFQDSDGKQRAPIRMLCSGKDTKTTHRSCRTTYVFEGLVVNYQFVQSRRWRVYEDYDIPPEGAIPEPEGLLEFDRRVRDWIIDMKVPQP